MPAGGFLGRITGLALASWWRLHVVALRLFAYIAFAASVLRRRGDYVEERWNGERRLEGAARIAVFVHYDRAGIVHDYVLYYLRQLRIAGFELVFVSNAPSLTADSLAELQTLCALMVRRRNVGYDFGAFRDGLALLGPLEEREGLEELLLANDSVYGPFHDLATLLRRADAGRASVWGITDSWQFGYHLQSYFLLFKRQALLSPAFAQFWRQVRYVQSKTWVVLRYEVGLSRALIRGGLRCAALFPYRQAATGVSEAVRHGGALAAPGLGRRHHAYLSMLFDAVDRGEPLNGSHYFWDYLIAEMGCPFLKRELLHKNPARVPFVHCWDSVIEASSSYDSDLILRHLEASMKNHCA
ncbi:rhamnan synthesis F family protein [Azospirillum doebereinerae]|uniref:Polysaccharide biosynthesis-like protein n=1 Tax=Azospirillum doebereinerae TaxID=92933 RepID=A0A433JE97_9PROT|nr:rhamnan synthesis F family protein [Azospirillum doebereinerae]RUQ75209.1 polysaccharide biosynthesis-like protein [Azospirillum doebereinerae]